MSQYLQFVFNRSYLIETNHQTQITELRRAEMLLYYVNHFSYFINWQMEYPPYSRFLVNPGQPARRGASISAKVFSLRCWVPYIRHFTLDDTIFALWYWCTVPRTARNLASANREHRCPVAVVKSIITMRWTVNHWERVGRFILSTVSSNHQGHSRAVESKFLLLCIVL